ncbi:MAG: alpha-E domain-containing protein [Bacteroidota bacterium]
MLARVAENLYWIGRNVERCEHCARYLKVQFFSTLDAPMSQNKDFTLRSILFMSGSNYQSQTILNENEVWQKVIFDLNNTNSILSLIQQTRENARSIRNVISEEFWESINRWYLTTKELDPKDFSSDDIFAFSEQMNADIVLIQSRLHHTFLHDDIWSFINLGIYVERALQILRIIRSKISDSNILSDNGVNQTILQYQFTTLLMCLEAFDIYIKKYQGVRSKKTIFDLVLMNDLFPRSFKYTSLKIKRHLHGISVYPQGHLELKENFDRILAEYLNFDSFSEEDQIISFVDKAYNSISNFHYQIEQLYFK